MGSACAPRRQSLWSWLPCRAGFDEIPSFILSLSHYGFPNRGWLMLRARAKLPDPVQILFGFQYGIPPFSVHFSWAKGVMPPGGLLGLLGLWCYMTLKLVLGEKVLLTSASLSGWVWLKLLALFLPSVKSHIQNFFLLFFFFSPPMYLSASDRNRLKLEFDLNAWFWSTSGWIEQINLDGLWDSHREDNFLSNIRKVKLGFLSSGL